MKLTKTTQVLGLVAILLAALSVYNYSQTGAKKEIRGAGNLFLADLEGTINEVRQIQLSGSEVTTTLRFDGKIWRIAERSNYPANPAYVQGLLSGLKGARRIEPKTSNPDYFDRLGLIENGLDVTVSNESGENLATLKAGDQFFSPAGGGITTFVLDQAASRAWTVSGLPQLSSFPAYWLAPEVVGISPLRVKSFEISFGDGQVWSAARSDLDGTNFVITPAGPVGVNPIKLQGVAFALNEVLLEDVTDMDALTPFLVASATYQTFDGLIITLEFYENDGTIWTTFAAEYNEEILLSADTPSVLLDAPMDGAVEAATLNALWDGRAFLISIEKISVILTRLEDMAG